MVALDDSITSDICGKAMKIELHPEARKNIDEQAFTLLRSFAPRPQAVDGSLTSTQRYIDASLNASEVQNLILHSRDGFGRVTGIHFAYEAGSVGVEQDGVHQLDRLIDTLMRSKEVRETLSREFLENQTLRWCRTSFGASERALLSDTLVAAAETAIASISIWIPVVGVEVDHEFPVGKTQIRPISSEMFDNLERSWLALAPRNDEAQDAVRAKLLRLRKKLQGLAAVVIDLEAEDGRAFEIALETADAVVSFLRLFTPAAYDPRTTSACSVTGELVGRTTALLFGGSTLLIDKFIGSHADLHLNASYISGIRGQGLDEMATLLNENGLNDFEQKLRKSLLTFSRSTIAANLNDKLVYGLSALEILLLKDSSEPIQQNLGERIAFLTRQTVADRRAVVENIKIAYSIRSKYVHHGQSSTEENELSVFFLNARTVLAAACKNIGRFQTKHDFLDAVDNVKYGGMV
jgi:hypothetical protein